MVFPRQNWYRYRPRMRILQKYILRQAMVTLLITLGVFTFVLLLGGLMRKLSDMLVNQQLGLEAVGWFLLLVTPQILSFSLPMAMLATTLLVFGRLSADSEVTAMRASGISIGQIAAPVILLGVLMAGLCFYINGILAPQTAYHFKTLFVRLGMERPMALLEEGAYMKDFPGYVVYVGKKKANVIEDVTIYMLDDKGNVISSLRAQKGIVTPRRETQTLLLDLYDVRGDLRDPSDPTNVRKIRAGTTARRYPVELDLGKILRKAKSTKKPGDFTLPELVDEIHQLKAQGIYPAAVLLETHGRVSAAVACIAFTLIGIPLGMKTSRRETSIGIAISLALAFAYYFVTIFATTLKDKPDLYPEAILWSPNLLFEIIGLWLLWRLSRK